MTVTNTNTRNDYLGTGSVGPYAYTFRIFAASDLTVTKRDASGVETTLNYPADYSVTGVGASAGGTVTLSTALAVNEALTIRRVLPLTQTTDLRNQGTLLPATLEDTFDRGVMQTQQVQEETDATVRLAETVSPADFNPTLPANMQPGDAIVVDALGTGFDMAALSAAQLTPWNASQNMHLDTFTSAGGDFTPGVTTTLTLTNPPGNENNLFITMRISGTVRVFEHDEYNVAASVVTFSSAIPAGATRVECAYLYTYQVNITAAENVTYAQAGAGASTSDVRAALRRMVWASDYGVVGDGTTDDTVAMQRALDRAATAKAILYCGSMIIKITAALTMNGPGLLFDTVSHGSAGGPGIKITGTGYVALTVTVSPQVFAACFYGTGQAVNGVLLQNVILSRFQALRVYNLDGYGVKINKCWDSIFETISVELCGNATDYAFSMNDDGDTCNMSHILRLQVEFANKKAIFISPNSVSCVIDNVHSERATPDASYITWEFGGNRVQYNSMRLQAASSPANARVLFTGYSITATEVAVEGAIDVQVDSFSTEGHVVLINPSIEGTFHPLNGQLGRIMVIGGKLAYLKDPTVIGNGIVCPTNAVNTTAAGVFLEKVNIAVAIFGFQATPNPWQCVLDKCFIGTMSSSSLVSAGIFKGCVIAEGGNLLENETQLIDTDVTCAGTLVLGNASTATLKMVNSTIHAALSYKNTSPIRMLNSKITGTVACGDAGAHNCLCDSQSTVGASTTDITAAPTGGAHLRGDTHWNPLPTSGATPGWRCTTAGTPGTWKAMANLA